MKNRKSLCTILLLLGSFVGFKAQESRTISLQDAIDLGIKNSKNLKIDNATIDQATAKWLAAKNAQLPDLKVSGSYMRLAKAKVDLKLPVSAGGNAGPDVNQVLYGSANLSLPLFAGGRIRYGIESANYLVEASKLSAESNKTAIAYNISQAYNNLFKAAQNIKVLEESLTASQQRDATFLKLENNGVITRNDRLKAQLRTSDIELQLLDAHNNYNIANINMDLLLGLPDTTQIAIDSSYVNDAITEETDVFYLSEAFRNRKDLQALEYQKRAAALGIKSAKAENYPTLALTGGYVAADIPNLLTVTNALNIGVGVQYNIANLWKKNSSLLDAKATEKQIEAKNELLNDNITLEVKRDYQNDISSHKKTEIYQRMLEQAVENYRITNNKFQNGLATMTELLDADTAKLSAQVNVINSKADASLAHKKLLQTIGIIN